MAHFAKLGSDNIVETVEVVSNDIATNEQAGITFLQNLYNDTATWKQTSYNTYGNVHKLGGTPFRKNYAGIGFTYHQTKDAFIPLKPFTSWTLNETTCRWEAPVAYPDDGKLYLWNEENQTWDLIE
jgi:hypothetical protein|tara:strand:- start:76 stop:453 length:378 start_codon:yes stop_codon:yes gene_type:complete